MSDVQPELLLPTTRPNLYHGHLHPEAVRRWNAFTKDDRIMDRCPAISIDRTMAQTIYFWDKYQAYLKRDRRPPKANLAANPYRTRADGVQASLHNPQSDGYSYAVDLTRGPFDWGHVHRVLDGYGLKPTVPGEAWHIQPMNDYNRGNPVFFDAPMLDKKPGRPPKPRPRPVDIPFADIITTVRWNPLRKGCRGKLVRLAQWELSTAGQHPADPKKRRWSKAQRADLAANGLPTVIDGIYGPGTVRAVKGYQTVAGLPADGIIGPATAAVLFANVQQLEKAGQT